jgi:hypothetical protein
VSGGEDSPVVYSWIANCPIAFDYGDSLFEYPGRVTLLILFKNGDRLFAEIHIAPVHALATGTVVVFRAKDSDARTHKRKDSDQCAILSLDRRL